MFQVIKLIQNNNLTKIYFCSTYRQSPSQPTSNSRQDVEPTSQLQGGGGYGRRDVGWRRRPLILLIGPTLM